MDYIASSDATYPDWLKYWALRSITTMGEYDKEKRQFGKRSKGTTKPFPDLNREALAYVLDAVEKKYSKQSVDTVILDQDHPTQFQELLNAENFAKLYAFAIEQVTPTETNLLTVTDGEWVKYGQIQSRDNRGGWGDEEQINTDLSAADRDRVMSLVRSLQGHGTGWCTAGESTATKQLKNADFYVYYSHDAKGLARIPRAAIRMEDDRIAEVRGIAAEQNLDPYIGEIVGGKMQEFGEEGKRYEKKASDMKCLTAIEVKIQSGAHLTKDELVFLYEIDVPIEGFGYQKDPRIAELRAQRDVNTDMPIIFECTPVQIAHNANEVSTHTKIYVGPLDKDIFRKLADVQYVYTEFPEKKICQFTLEVGGLDVYQLIAKINKTPAMPGATGMMQVERSTVSTLINMGESIFRDEKETMRFLSLTAADLGFSEIVSIEDLLTKAGEVGLQLCPLETGLYYRLQYIDQPVNEVVFIGMQPIRQQIFNLAHYPNGSELRLVQPGFVKPNDKFVFKVF